VAERVLFVHAHPGDETIQTGATIATLIQRGAEVAVLTCTRGERGDVIPADLKHLLESPEQLGEFREGELATALAALGVTDHRMLGEPGARWEGLAARSYLDSGTRRRADGVEEARDSTEPDSLSAARLGEVAADIAAVLIEFEPDVVVSCDVDGGDGHPDHIRVHEATRTAAEVIGVPFYVIDPTATKSAVTVDAAAVANRKRAALAAYRSQLTIDADTFSLSRGAPRPIVAAERFRRLRPPGDAFSDHTLASRIFSSVLALVLGAFAGATLTVAHEATVPIAGASVPWGIIVGVLVMTGLIVGLRLVFETRVVAACAAAGLIVASALLSLPSPGGSVLIPGTAAGYTWTFAPVIISIIALAVPWPLPSRTGRAPND